MKAYLSTHLAIALYALLIVALILGSAWYIDRTFRDIDETLTTYVEHNTLRLKEFAEITDRNGADELTEKIIIDCPRRAEFEDLLGSLGTASRRELLEAQQLFESCGSYFAERKAFMVDQMEREFDVLKKNLVALQTVRDLTTDEEKLQTWRELIELEKKRSDFLAEQTTIQKEIIQLLISGGQPQRINDLVRQAQHINESLNITDADIDELRVTLM